MFLERGGLIFNKMYNSTGRIYKVLYSPGWEGTCYIREGGKIHAIFTRVGRFMPFSRGWEGS